MRTLEFTTLVCLRIQQVGHAKAVNSNVTNQLKRGNFEIASIDLKKWPSGRVTKWPGGWMDYWINE